MQNPHDTVSRFITGHSIDLADFNAWFHDAGYAQDEANVHDSRYLEHLNDYVEERNANQQMNASG